MAFTTQTLSVHAATQLVVPGSGASGSGTFLNTTGSATDPLPLLIMNLDGTNSVTIGGSDVASAGGIVLKAGLSIPFDCLNTDATSLYGYGGANTVSVCIMAGRQ
jgi:hypothetical protein